MRFNAENFRKDKNLKNTKYNIFIYYSKCNF